MAWARLRVRPELRVLLDPEDLIQALRQPPARCPVATNRSMYDTLSGLNYSHLGQGS